ncbi:negative elongation factor A-like isoform X2 [Lytechinus pictus]|uniref:negative elongation factor A-like isoform X2 n=1 Tax=Lytechinus pictus TaxID=7653 RepID=UPI0030B9D680
MATVRDSDTSLWLHNKLGDNDDLWSGITSISTQLHQDVLRNTHDCFQTLHPTVKLKLLMAILHMPLRKVEECKEELSGILHQALTDTDEWVATVADILRSYPVSGQLNLELEDSHPFLAEALHELRKTLATTDTNSLLPMECIYLNKNALNQLVGMQAPPVKHFTLKRKPKSAALRAELLQKSNEAQQQQKKPMTPTHPSKIRGGFRGFDDIPLKGIPGKSSPSFRASQSPAFNRSLPLNRAHGRMSLNREGGTKLLDIKEQPIGGSSREAKRRKKQAEQEAAEQAKKEKEATMQQTPDYAAALMSPAVNKPANVPTTQAPATPQPATPSYVPTVTLTKPPTPSLLGSLGQPSGTTAARENLQQQLQQLDSPLTVSIGIKSYLILAFDHNQWFSDVALRLNLPFTLCTELEIVFLVHRCVTQQLLGPILQRVAIDPINCNYGKPATSTSKMCFVPRPFRSNDSSRTTCGILLRHSRFWADLNGVLLTIV